MQTYEMSTGVTSGVGPRTISIRIEVAEAIIYYNLSPTSNIHIA